MNECPNAQAFGQSGGSIGARIIHKDLYVYFIREFANGLLQSAFGVVGRHDYRDPFSVDHQESSSARI
jgi:hypothetical protein